VNLNDLGTTGLVAYVQAGKNGRARNMRRVHAERVLATRYASHSFLVIERFRNILWAPKGRP
jgi:hypothetical protein